MYTMTFADGYVLTGMTKNGDMFGIDKNDLYRGFFSDPAKMSRVTITSTDEEEMPEPEVLEDAILYYYEMYNGHVDFSIGVKSAEQKAKEELQKKFSEIGDRLTGDSVDITDLQMSVVELYELIMPVMMGL